MSTLPTEQGGEPVNPYNLRGWCNFEQLVSAFSQGPILDLGSLDLNSDKDLIQVYKEKKKVINAANFAEVLVNLHGHRRVPMEPHLFDTFINERHGSVPLPTLVTGEELSKEDQKKNEELEEEDKKNWKIKITSGKDRAFLGKKYRETFESMALSAYRFYFNDPSWGDAEVALLNGVLPFCKNLRTLHIAGINITYDGILTLFHCLKALREKGVATDLTTIFLGSQDETVVNFLTRNCKADLNITVIKTDIVAGFLLPPPANDHASLAQVVGWPGVRENKKWKKGDFLQAQESSYSGNLRGRSSSSFQRLASSLLEATDNMIGHSEQLEDNMAAKNAIIAAQEERIRAQKQRIQDQNARIAALERQAARRAPARHPTTRARTTVRNRNARASSTGNNNRTDTGNEYHYC